MRRHVFLPIESARNCRWIIGTEYLHDVSLSPEPDGAAPVVGPRAGGHRPLPLLTCDRLQLGGLVPDQVHGRGPEPRHGLRPDVLPGRRSGWLLRRGQDGHDLVRGQPNY